jgi:hypothetical protein
LAGWMIRLFPSGEVVLFVADHFKLVRAQYALAHRVVYYKMNVDASVLKKMQKSCDINVRHNFCKPHLRHHTSWLSRLPDVNFPFLALFSIHH